VDAHKIPDKGCRVTCKNCNNRIFISKPSPQDKKPEPPLEKVCPEQVEPPAREATAEKKQPPKPPQTVQKRKPPKKKSFLKTAAVMMGLLLACVGVAAFCIFKFDIRITQGDRHPESSVKTRHVVAKINVPQASPKQLAAQVSPPETLPAPVKAANGPLGVSELFKKVNKATATVITYDSGRNLFKQGSGFFINEQGHFITCYHVMKGAYSAVIKIEDDQEYKVDYVIAQDEDADLIKLAINIPEGTLPKGMWLEINDKKPGIADKIMVISTPMGLGRTVSDGIISAIREIPTKGLAYQMTAPISPGSSGSAVIDMKGNVVGVSFMQLVEGQNLNFAIPSQKILKLKNEPQLTLASWTEKVNTDKNDKLKKIQKDILHQIDPHKTIEKTTHDKKFQSTKELLRLKLATQVVKESGIARQSKSFSESTLSSFEKKYKESLATRIKEPDEEDKKIDKFKEAIKLATNPTALNEDLEYQLASNLSADELKEVLKWYKSPLGKKISAIEYSSFAEKKEMFQKLQLAFRLAKYQTTERLNLFTRLDEATNTTNAMIDLQTNMIIQNRILELILSDFKKPDQASIDKIVESYKNEIDPYLDTLTGHLVFAGIVYTYRGVPKNEIKQYVQFSETAAARHFYDVLNKESNAFRLESQKRILTSIIRIVENDSWVNIKKDLNKPITG
jgi:S1-C subfamily serine protease